MSSASSIDPNGCGVAMPEIPLKRPCGFLTQASWTRREVAPLLGPIAQRADRSGVVGRAAPRCSCTAPTKYVLVLDDDVVFSRHTRLGPAITRMERNPEIDLMGGNLIDLPFYRRRRSADAPDTIFHTRKPAVLPIGAYVEGLQVRAKV